MNYTVFDVETANSQRDSICAIGIIRVENGRVVYEKEILINPETEFDYFNIRIHNIRPCDVQNAPTFPEVWKQILSYFNDTVLIAHNAKSMDLCALYRTLERYQLPLVNNRYICTMEVAKVIFKNDDSVQSYRLDVLASKCGIQLLNHHNALDDARACFELFKKLQENLPGKIASTYYHYEQVEKSKCCGNHYETIYSDKTKEMQKLQEIVKDIIADEKVSGFEIQELEKWLVNHDNLKGFYPYDKIFGVVEKVMADGILDMDEQVELLDLLDVFVNPKTEKTPIKLEGKTICLSGDFVYGSKKQVEEFLSDRGAIIAKSVTGKIDILILGEAGSIAWKYGNYGSKYEKACQLNEKGKNITILKEKDIII